MRADYSGRLGSEFERVPRPETFQQRLVRRGEAPAAHPSMSGNQAIEGITGPGEIECGGKPGGRRRIVECPSIVDRERLGIAFRQLDATHLVEKLEFEEVGWRSVETPAATQQWGGARAALIEPDQGERVEQDQRRFRDWRLKLFGVQLQLHCPSATAGSSTSILGFRRRRRAGASDATDNRKRVPWRSMMTASPRSAWSSASERRSLTCATV
jgi:hypothetical protein